MSKFKNNSLAIALFGALVCSAVVIQGCSSDEQNTPAAGGSGGSGHAGTAGKPATAGSAGKPVSEGGAAGEEQHGDGGMGNDAGGMGGEGGEPSVSCDLSFDNGSLTAITDNGGKLPSLP